MLALRALAMAPPLPNPKYATASGHERLWTTQCLRKSILDAFDCNLKTNYQILIIFGLNIPDTTCHQMTIVSHLTQCMLLHYLGKADQAKYVLK